MIKDFNNESLKVFLEMKYADHEQYDYYIGYLAQSRTFGEARYVIDESPVHVINSLLGEQGIQITLEARDQIQDLAGYVLNIEDGHKRDTAQLYIIGATSEEYLNLIESAEVEKDFEALEMVESIIEAYHGLGNNKVEFNIEKRLQELLTDVGYGSEGAMTFEDRAYLVGVLKDWVFKYGRHLRYHFDPKLGAYGGWSMNEDDEHQLVDRFIDIIDKYIAVLNDRAKEKNQRTPAKKSANQGNRSHNRSGALRGGHNKGETK
jgi:hypothetical protein